MATDCPDLENILEIQKTNFEMISVLPDDYDAFAEKSCRDFAARLKEARLTYRERKAEQEKNELSQREVASYVRVSTTMIHKYESGKIKQVPLNRLQPLCEFLDVTPHYLLGLVEGPSYVLDIEDGKRVKDSDGKDRVLFQPFSYDPFNIKVAAEKYKRLYMQDSELFWLIDRLVNTPPQSRDYYKGVLCALLDHDRFSLK